MNWRDLIKVVVIALLVSFVLLIFNSVGGGSGAMPIFVFYFIVIFYLVSDELRILLNKKDDEAVLNKNFNWLIPALVYIGIVYFLTGLTVSYIVNYCDGIFENEMRCELQKAEDGIFKYYYKHYDY